MFRIWVKNDLISKNTRKFCFWISFVLIKFYTTMYKIRAKKSDMTFDLSKNIPQIIESDKSIFHPQEKKKKKNLIRTKIFKMIMDNRYRFENTKRKKNRYAFFFIFTTLLERIRFWRVRYFFHRHFRSHYSIKSRRIFFFKSIVDTSKTMMS